MPSPKSNNDYNGDINNTISEYFYFIIANSIFTSPRKSLKTGYAHFDLFLNFMFINFLMRMIKYAETLNFCAHEKI